MLAVDADEEEHEEAEDGADDEADGAAVADRRAADPHEQPEEKGPGERDHAVVEGGRAGDVHRRRCYRSGKDGLARSGPVQKKFTEPVALLSTSPVNLWLPPTALGSGFDLLALRARCKNESTGSDTSLQASTTHICRILRPGNCPHFHDFSGGLGRTLWISGEAA